MQATAIFDTDMIYKFIKTVTFESYLENLPVENVIEHLGIDSRYLPNDGTIHPHEILVIGTNLQNIKNIAFKQLFKTDQLFEIEFNTDIPELYIPLSSFANQDYFNLIDSIWIKSYIITLCDYSIDNYVSISIPELLQCVDITKEYVFENFILSIPRIENNQIIRINQIPNPFIL